MSSSSDVLRFRVTGLNESPEPWLSRCLQHLRAAGAVRVSCGDVDFILELGTRPTLRSGKSPRFGHWTFNVGGHEIGAATRACRAALAEGRYSIYAQLLAQADGTDETLIREGRIPLIVYSLGRSVEGVLDELARWPAYAFQALSRSGRVAGPRILADVTLPGDDPTRFLSVCLARNALHRAWRVLFRHDHWNVGVVERPIQDFLGPGPEREVQWRRPPPAGLFRADPFGVRDGDQLVVLYEELPYALGRGRIVGESWDGDGTCLCRSVAMDGEGHLSYPYLLEHEGDIYCVPESSDRERVDLYRAAEAPAEWEKVATLLRGVRALDPTVFRHDGRWWLFATDADLGPRHVLLAWHAPELCGPWEPHASNPVKVDIHAARPAGTPFRHGGKLFRPAQDGARRYGDAVVINRIAILTPWEFAEEAVSRITLPSDGPYPDGIHTLSAVGPDLTLVDGNRVRFSAVEFGLRLRRLLTGALR